MSRPHAIHKSLPLALLRTREAVMASFRPHLAELGLTEQQWRVLRVLGETSDITAGDLADRACILPASLSRILKTLSEERLIVLKPHAEDARRMLVSLSPKGEKRLSTALPATAAIYRQLEKRIGAGELMQLQRLLEHVQASLQRS
jgi:homoprotocatechuate degradation regulator HpaR